MGEAERLISDPACFLHRVDVAADHVTFVRADPSALRRASFVDGRSDFWSGPPIRAPLAPLLALNIETPSPDRFIFHMGFGGSTLLSRLLDRAGATLVLREPQALTDLSAYRFVLDTRDYRDNRLAPAVDLARALLHRRWDPNETIVIKPSNWINNLLPIMVASARPIRALVLSIERRTYLQALFRGGSARLAFAARAAVHFSGADTEGAAWVAAALARPVDNLDKLAALGAIAHRLQSDLFAAASKMNPSAITGWITDYEIRAAPQRAAKAAAAALSLTLPVATDHALLQRHAKQPDAIFSASEQARTDEVIEHEYGSNIDRALDWVDCALPPVG